MFILKLKTYFGRERERERERERVINIRCWFNFTRHLCPMHKKHLLYINSKSLYRLLDLIYNFHLILLIFLVLNIAFISLVFHLSYFFFIFFKWVVLIGTVRCPLTATLCTFFFHFIAALCHIFAAFSLWDQLYKEKKY